MREERELNATKRKAEERKEGRGSQGVLKSNHDSGACMEEALVERYICLFVLFVCVMRGIPKNSAWALPRTEIEQIFTFRLS